MRPAISWRAASTAEVIGTDPGQPLQSTAAGVSSGKIGAGDPEV
jgi:hypothetical protein